MSRWLEQVHAAAAAPAELGDQVVAAHATVFTAELTAGERALDAGRTDEAAAHWRVAAALDDSVFDEASGEKPVALRLIELYLRVRKPLLALAWCAIAADAGAPVDQVQPLTKSSPRVGETPDSATAPDARNNTALRPCARTGCVRTPPGRASSPGLDGPGGWDPGDSAAGTTRGQEPKPPDPAPGPRAPIVPRNPPRPYPAVLTWQSTRTRCRP
ncbi:hypothetical protein [Amycolatopsis rubida]|uniref:Uncharacterized protein n=1 Tax=Amycolatopsis rubida TaxID=112413 RepID=A0A1I5X611_9PSEU|nr:hypothetical protein [Amycolatopsis rubida]SFQ27412.1 hypothetical protein SAMN05421854_11052 [Amycolatopsis rubida]